MSFLRGFRARETAFFGRRSRTAVGSPPLGGPVTELFDVFDDLTLMAAGRIVYHGPRAEVLEYFQRLGFRPWWGWAGCYASDGFAERGGQTTPTLRVRRHPGARRGWGSLWTAGRDVVFWLAGWAAVWRRSSPQGWWRVQVIHLAPTGWNFILFELMARGNETKSTGWK